MCHPAWLVGCSHKYLCYQGVHLSCNYCCCFKAVPVSTVSVRAVNLSTQQHPTHMYAHIGMGLVWFDGNEPQPLLITSRLRR